ncbi:cohesin domain-containing protein [Paucibacter sp. M5-1]|uniref:cohesin domain-containing protein n=1 Tax=Paucibacter sp. M5-1 TaxID=3015998 RepID=UPI0022B93AEB|nr:cohesin domain-containing protein [Paucibacter sp. M5-1]MCZ7880034.1 cohesin domain-containing protein [Paucibacter sp. M5-1]
MSRYERLCALIGAALMSAALMAMPGAAGAGTVSLSTGAGAINVGDSFSLRLKISGLSAAPGDSLSGFDLKLKFDNTVSAFLGADFVDAASGVNQLDHPEMAAFPFLGDAALVGADTVSAFGLSGNSPGLLDAQQLDAFVFLTLRFSALAESSSALFSLDLSDPGLLFADADSGVLAVDFDISRLSLSIGPGSNPVSEPPALALALSALLLMGRSVRRARSPERWVGARTAALLAGSGLLFAAGLASAAPEPVAKQGGATATAGQGAVAGRVIEVQGQRIKLRSASGSEVWYTVSAPITSSIINKQARGQARPLGDALLLDTPVFD